MRIFLWWLLPDSNWGHKALQASALPTELKSRQLYLFHFTGKARFLQPLGALARLFLFGGNNIRTTTNCIDKLYWEQHHRLLALFGTDTLQGC